jgi:hypothetical protein
LNIFAAPVVAALKFARVCGVKQLQDMAGPKPAVSAGADRGTTEDRAEHH